MDASATGFFLVQLFVYLIYFAAALAFINEQRRLRKVTITILIFGFLIAVFSIIQSFSSEGAIYWSRTHPGAIPFGTYINRHHFAALMEMTIALSLGLIYAGAVTKELRAIQIFSTLIMGVALVMTGSRGALLSLMGIIGFLTLLSLKTRKRGDRDDRRVTLLQKLMPVAGGLMLVLTIFGTVLFLGGENELTRSIGLIKSDDVSAGRLHFWQTTLQVIRDNLLLGVGLDALGSAYTRYDTWNGIFRVDRAHNDYLQVFAEAGILGFVSLIAFLYFLFRRGYQILTTTRDTFRRSVALGALAGCFGIAVHSFFDFPLRTPANALVFLTLATLATVQISYPKLHRRRNN
jgi:O-antigen ligase